MTTTIRDTPTTGGEAREATSWSLYVVHHPSAKHVGLRRVLLEGLLLRARLGLPLLRVVLRWIQQFMRVVWVWPERWGVLRVSSLIKL